VEILRVDVSKFRQQDLADLEHNKNITEFHLSCLCDLAVKVLPMLKSYDIPYCEHFKSFVDEVKAFVLPLRPNFKFYVSCCEMFDESRVGRTTIL
jgi:hypothetical protein